MKRGSRKAARFGLMVAGQAGLGKTSFLATVFDQIDPPHEEVGGEATDPIRQRIFTPTTEITAYSVEVEPQGGTRLLVDIIDTPGFDDDLSPQEQAELVLRHLEGSFDDVFGEEQRVRRNPKFEDRRVHALLYFIESTSLGLKRFDAEFMKHIGSRVNVIPVLAKADGFAEAEEARQAQLMIMAEIEKAQIPIYDFSQADGGSVALRARQPFLISGAIHLADGSRRERAGSQRIPSDVALLKAILLDHARDDLKEHTEDALYEEYRTEKLLALGPSHPHE